MTVAAHELKYEQKKLPVLDQPVVLSVVATITHSQNTVVQLAAAAFGLIIHT